MFYYNWISRRKFHFDFSQAIFRCKTVSKVFSPTTDTLSISLYKSVQFGQLCRKLHNMNRRNSTRKSRIKAPLGLVTVSFAFGLSVGKDKIYPCHCSKQTSKLPQLQNIYLNLGKITFIAIYWLSRCILLTLVIDESE